MAVAFKQNTLTKKEQEAKQRLYGGKPPKQQQQQQSPPYIQFNINRTKDVQQPFKQVFNAPSNQQIDQFLKDMEKDFQQTSQSNKNNIIKEQVTIGMLSTQQELMRQQNEQIAKTQQQMAELIKRQTNNNGNSDQVVQNILQPFNQQLGEIKQLYQNLKNTTNNIQNEIKNKSENINMNDYQQQNNQLKQILETTQNNLQILQPENFQQLQNFTNFNLQLYQNTVQNLQDQIAALQNDQYSTEQELNIKYKQLNDARLASKIQKNTTVEDEILKQIEQRVQSIDYNKAQQNLNDKLGGDFDYDNLLNEISELTSSAQNVCSDFQDQGKAFDIVQPEFKIDHEDMKALENKPTSILDELKETLGIPNRPPPKQQQQQQQQLQQQQQQQQQQQLKQDSGKKTLKPQHIQNIQSRPIEPPKDIKFEKQSNATNNYQPIIEQKEQQKVATQQKQKPVNKEKLVYRAKSEQKQKPSVQDAKQAKKQEVPQVQNWDPDADSDEGSYRQISYQPLNQPTNQISSQQGRQQQSKQKQNQQQQQNQFDIKNQDNNDDLRNFRDDDMDIHNPDKRQDIQKLYHKQQMDREYVDALNDPRFINYDQLVKQVSQVNEYTTQEEKSEKILDMIGIKRENPRNQVELVELLSRDILREKMMQNKQYQASIQDQYDRKQNVKKNQSIQYEDPKPQPTLQEQAANGAQAVIQGFFQALNATLAQVNQGLANNVQPQIKQIVQIESSRYSESSEEEQQQRQANYQTQQIQQYTFSQPFQQQQQQPQHHQQQQQQQQPQQNVVNLKDYYKKFEFESEMFQSQESAVNRSGSYGGSIFKLDDSYGKKSEGQISLVGVKKAQPKQKESLSKDIFKDLNQDLSEGEIQPVAYKKN